MMIDSKELRLGNKIIDCGIDYDAGGNKVRDRDGDEVIDVDIDVIKDCIEFPNHYEGIPLTPEWLQRCGLKDVAGNGMGYRMNINSSDELCWYMQDNSLSYQTQGSGFTRSMEHIQYLHQLQNWFYSFTGEELQIKL